MFSSAVTSVVLDGCLVVAAVAACFWIAVGIGGRIDRIIAELRKEREAELLEQYPEVMEFLLTRPGDTHF